MVVLSISQPVAPVCISLLILFFVMNLVIPDSSSKLGLVTVNTIIVNSYVWNLVTSCFYENSLIKLILDFIGLGCYMRYRMEYGPFDQFALFFAFNILACTIGTSAWCFMRFFFTGMESMLLDPIFGFSGVLMMLLVHARSQLRNEPIIFNQPSITYNNLPIIITFFQILFWITGFRFLARDLPFTIIGLLFSWGYLRYHMKNEV